MFKSNRRRGGEGSDFTAALLPLRDIVIFPDMVVPLFVGRGKSIHALEHALKAEDLIFLVAQKNSKINDPTLDDLYQVGILAQIVQVLRLPDGTVKVLVEGKTRARIEEAIHSDPFVLVKVEDLSVDEAKTSELEAFMRSVKEAFYLYAKLNKKLSKEVGASIEQIENPDRLADTILNHLTIKLAEKQKLLESLLPSQRLERLYVILQSEIEILEIERKIKARVKRQMEKSQKEYYLSEQMRAIQKEMGEKDDLRSEIKALEKREAQRILEAKGYTHVVIGAIVEGTSLSGTGGLNTAMVFAIARRDGRSVALQPELLLYDRERGWCDLDIVWNREAGEYVVFLYTAKEATKLTHENPKGVPASF